MSQIEPQEDVDYDDVFEAILNDAQSRGLSDNQVWEVWQTGSKQEYNDALEWAAEWITGSQMLGHSDDVVKFAENMAMSIRAAKRPNLQRAADAQYLCARCGHPRSEHPSKKCAAFAIERR